MAQTEQVKPDATLDLRGVVCPMNWVQIKLKLEEMETGQVLELILDEGDATRNVPRSIQTEGHKILVVTPLGGAFKLLVERGADQ